MEDDVFHLSKTDVGSYVIYRLTLFSPIVLTGDSRTDTHGHRADNELQPVVLTDVGFGGVVVGI